MAQYRKMPVVIDAEQFFYDGPRVRGVFYPDLSDDGRTWIGDAFVITIHDQRVYLQSGDWIVAEPDGEHYYPVKPDIFAATYEPAPTNSELQETLDIFSRLQSEHSDLIERERVLEAEAADLRRQLDAAVHEIQVLEEISERKTANFRERLQAEKDAHQRTLSLQDDEVAEFNAGYEACKNGEPIEAEPTDLPFDVWRQGWKVADHERLSAEVADLRQQLEVAQAERDAADAEMSYARTLLGDPVGVDIAVMGLLTEIAKLKTEIDKRDKWAWDVLKTPMLTGIDVPELLRDLDIYKAETHRLLVDNAKMRFYIVELERESRTIDMQLAQQAAREKYEAAFGDHAAEGRPIGVDIPSQPYCQLPEGHGGPHDH